ncbi:MAG: VWA domain-containing protein, partial [Bacteroidales bacterium]|nr:VWA domain-containing protein [Bacteroidales bacterium]
MFKFESPQWFYGLMAVLLLLTAAILVIRHKTKRFARLGSPSLLLSLIPDYSVGKQYVKNLLLLFAATCLIVALANPQIGTTVRKAERKGVDLMVALDISNSMNCEDIQPSRLMRSKQALIRLLDKLGNDRIGLVVFAGDAFLQLPLTSDYGAAKLFISEIGTDDISTQGTSIGAAIDLCLKSFDTEEHGNAHNKAIIVISDGEDHEAAALAAAQRAAKAGIAVHTIGMGLPQGAPIPVYSNGRIIDYKKDRRGQTVMTKLNEDMLRQIATEGKGHYVGANNTSAGVEKVFDEINRLDKTLLEQRDISDYESRYQIPLMAAIICLILEIFVFSRQHRRLNRKHLFGMKNARSSTAPAAVILLLAGLSAAPSALQAQAVPLTHEGNRLYQKEDYAAAEEAYRKGLALDSTTSRLLYNLGNTQYQQGLYPQAAELYNKV